MKEGLLIIAMFGIFVYGYFLMGKLGKFLEENHRTIEEETEKKEPSCVMLTENLSDEEIIEEIHRFRNKHEKLKIILYDFNDTELLESFESSTDSKS